MNKHELLRTILTERLRGDLPGWPAQAKMSPVGRVDRSAYRSRLEHAKISAVLLLLYPLDAHLHTVLIERTSYDGVHSGQISMPGGSAEAHDLSLAHTALREAAEEVNIDPAEVTLLGSLTELYIPPSNFLVYPNIGYAERRPEFKREEKEVERIIEVPLNLLKNPEIVKSKKIRMSSGLSIETPYFDVHGYTVWGATAMVISEFIHLVREIDELT